MNLRTSITSMIVPFVLVIVVAIIAVEKMGKDVVVEHAEKDSLSAKNILLNKIISSHIGAMSSGLFAITRNHDALTNIVNGDNSNLSSVLLPTYNRLSASGVINVLEMTDANGKTIYSSTGDTSSPSTMPLVKSALAEGKIKQGIQRGNTGELFASYVFPLYEKPGKAIGAGVFLISLKKALEEFKQSEGSDVYIIGENNKLEYSTNNELWDVVAERVASLTDGRLVFHSHGDVVHHLGRISLALAESNEKVSFITVEDSTSLYNSIKFTDWVAISVSLVLMLAMAIGVYLFVRRALNPLAYISWVLSEIAKGDLTNDIRISRKGEIGEILGALSDMQEKLAVVISKTAESTLALDSTSSFMSELSEKTNTALEQQKNEADHVVVAMNEMSATAGTIASNAGHAAESAKEADHEAVKGQKVVRDTVASIQRLAEEVERGSQVINELDSESNNIGSVLDVIRDIAEQTNLLALNAAIEAARAGEQGRGFAVVADEVRTLASRTAESTAEIQKMIERLQSGAKNAVSVMEIGREQAQASVEQAQEAGTALDTITQMVTNITDLNAQIASASEEQTAVTEEINTHAHSIRTATDTIANEANEATEVGERLVMLSKGLTSLVSSFKLKEK